jgi:endonuclease/exonuclease/phosphatase (EEP) superfamily protein YafD
MFKKSTFILSISLWLLLSHSLSFANTDIEKLKLNVMTLNVYGWKTMPQHSGDYAALINKKNVDVLGIQEGVEDWKLTTQYPTDYARSSALHNSLGECWQHQFQIFINTCHGFNFVDSHRFDLSDGPNATRTGEWAIVEKQQDKFLLVNVHWDHQSQKTRQKNANETAAVIESKQGMPVILLGDFNISCKSQVLQTLVKDLGLTLTGDAGIDCIFTKHLAGKSSQIDAAPSDHPSLVAELTL